VISPVFWKTQTPNAKLVKPEPMNEITCPNHTAAKARGPSKMGRLFFEIKPDIIVSISVTPSFEIMLFREKQR
jgi:hypothetical protein